ncbi:MAG: hypothetical protein KDK08_02655 [Rhizobiaceae bacterium]|nr:hypothetical protein [Rhizobiaceae bacterium]
MTKYARLTDFLEQLGPSFRRMSFAEIEKVLEFSLPDSARRYQAWWANNPVDGRHSMAWLSAGWQTEDLDLRGESVTFRRAQDVAAGQHGSTVSRSRPERADPPASVEDLPDAPEGDVRITIAMQWKRLGVVVIDEDGKLSFPAAPRLPALYRLRLIGAAGVRHYIGEAVDLHRRFGNYRNPGPTQKTSIRINEALRSHLASGDHVEVDLIARNIELSIGGADITFNLADKATRRLLEQAAVVANAAIDIESLNR